MGFGVISSSLRLAGGVAPPLISASVNAAKIPTGLVATLSHWRFGNIDPKIVVPVSLAGALGGFLGAMLLSILQGHAAVVTVSVFLVALGAIILWRGLTGGAPRVLARLPMPAIGGAGGLIEGIGGSWGPVVTTGLLASGHPPRQAIGSSVTAELLVSVLVFATMMTTLSQGLWGAGEAARDVLPAVAGLVAGGVPAAVLGGWIVVRVPRRAMNVLVGSLAMGIGLWRLYGLV